MDKKNKSHTPLSDVDHKMRFVNLIGVINELTPVIKRNKMLGNVLVEINDTTMSNPGFFTTLNLESETLDQFLAVARKGLIIELFDIKVAKNDGEIRGEVCEEEEVRLYNDDGSRLNWWVEEKRVPTSDKVKRSIEELKKWKKSNIYEDSETPKIEKKAHKEKRSLQNESINLERSRSSIVSQKRSSVSGEESVKGGGQKRKVDSAKRTNTSIDISVKNSPKDSTKVNSVSAKSTPKMRKHKIIDEKTEKHDSFDSDMTKKKKLTTSPELLRGVTEGISGRNKSVPQSTSFKNSETNKNTPTVKSNRMKNESKTVEQKFKKDKVDKTTNKRTSINISESRPSTSSVNLKRESKRLKYDSPASDIEISKSSPLEKKAAKETLSGRMIRSKGSFSNSLSNSMSSSCSLNSLDSDVSRCSVKAVSGSVKRVGKSQKELGKQGEKSDDSKGNQNKASALSKEMIENITKRSTKITRSNSCTNISQLKVLKSTVGSARYSSPIRISKVLSSSTTNLKKQFDNNKSRKNTSQNANNDKAKEKSQQNECSTPINDDRNNIQKEKSIKKTENVDRKLNDSIIKKNITDDHQKSSNQDISIVDNNITSRRQRTMANKKALRPKSSEQEESPKLLKSKSKMGSKEISTSSDKKDLMSSLASFTRKAHLIEVEYNGEVSTCDIEDVEVPEKMDLQVKVLSTFHLFEDNIQVVRVQDGTICESPTLCIPQKGSWKDVVATVLENPQVKRKSPCIDIIIFDFQLMDSPIVSGEMYDFKNVMAIKLNFKDDPRKEKKMKGELFFCVKGPNIYNKKSSPKIREELEKRISEQKYKKLLAEFLGEKELIMGLSNEKSPPKTPKLGHDDPFQADHKNSTPQKTLSPTNRKRKLAEVDNQTKDNNEASLAKSQKIDSEERTLREVKMEMLRKRGVKNLPKINPVALSDEAVFGETDCLIIKELSEIIHEESLLGLPQIMSEDIHLKNTGSEVTFSQFCAGVEGKADNFRTSTQAVSLSEDIVPLDQKSHTPDSSRMEPLVYSPSSCSLSDITPNKQSPNKSPEKSKDLKECSESILKNYTLKAISDEKPNSPKLRSSKNKLKDIEETTNKLPIDNDSLCVEVLSSNSSVVEVEVISEESLSKKDKDTANETNNKHCKVSAKKSGNELENKNLDHNLEMELEGNSFDKEEDAESLKSTISNFSFKCYVKSVTREKDFYSSPNLSGRSKIMDPKIETEDSSCQYPSSFEQCKRIPESCFFQSARNQYPSTEEINAIFNEENHSLKYFSYSLDRNLPFLTFDVIRKLDSRNYITVMVTIEKISPSITDSWKNECIKARCPCCNKLYSAYNAFNNKCNENPTSSNALYVRGLILCPESQCCNQVLETPEFQFTVETKLKDGTPVTALVAGTHAEEIFGCKAQDAVKDESTFSHIEGILRQIAARIDDRQFAKIDFQRENICNPKSGPLYIKKIYF